MSQNNTDKNVKKPLSEFEKRRLDAKVQLLVFENFKGSEKEVEKEIMRRWPHLSLENYN